MRRAGDTPYAIRRPMRIGPFLLRGLMGRGGTAEVYAAVDERDGTEVALKVADRAGALRAACFRREASLAARLRHAHVVRLVHTGTLEDDRPFLAFERIDGPTLESVADSLERDAIVAVGEQLLDALAYAHDAGVVHCDVKPANVLVERWDGALPRIKLADFGLAGAREPSLDGREAPLAGTPGYMSPEQARGLVRLGPRSDLCSLGALLYRLVSGRPPHVGATLFEIIDSTVYRDADPPTLRVPIEPALVALIMRLLARAPEERPPSAARALTAWRAAAARGGARSRAEPSPRAASPARDAVTADTRSFASLAEGALGPSSTLARAALRGQLAAFAPSAASMHGRELERAALLAARDRARLVDVVAGRGLGATRLVAAVAAAARATGAVAHVATRRGIEPGPLEVVASLARALAEESRDAVAAEGAEVLGDALVAAGVPAGDPGRDALVAGLAGVPMPVAAGSVALAAYAALSALVAPAAADRAPVLLVVDGLEGLDAASREVLDALVVSDQRVCVLTIRDEATPPLAGAGTPVAPTQGASTERHVLGPLAPDAAVALLSDGSRTAAETDLGPLVQLAEGRATRLALLRGALRWLPAPRIAAMRTWDDAVAAIVGACSAGDRACLALAAAMGGDAPLAALAEITPRLVPGADGSAILLRLLERRLLVPVDRALDAVDRVARVADPDVAAAALAALAADEGARASRELARWLADESPIRGAGGWASIALHAERGGSRRLAAYALAEAARASASDAGGARTTALVDRALDLAASDAEARDATDVGALLAIGAEALLDAGHAERARGVARRALRATEPIRATLRAHVANAIARAAVELRDLDGALAAIRDGLAMLGEHGDPQEQAALLAHEGWIVGYLQGDNGRGIALGRRAMEVAARIDAPAFRASLCGRLGANLLRAGDWDGQLAINREDLELSLAARDPRGVIRAHINLGVCFTNRGDLVQARAHTEDARSLAERHGWSSPLQIAHNNLAMIALDDGRHADAHAHGEAVLALHARLGIARGLGETLCTLSRLALREGDLDAARALLARARAGTEGTAEEEVVRRIDALIALGAGDVAAALEITSAILASDASDPYERAASRLTRAAALRASGDAAAADDAECEADAVLARLGADPVLERRRWQ